MAFHWRLAILVIGFHAVFLTTGLRSLPRVNRYLDEPTELLPGDMTIGVIEEAFDAAREVLKSEAEISGRQSSVVRARNMSIASSRHMRLLTSGKRSKSLERMQRTFEAVTRILLSNFGLTREQIFFGLSHLELDVMERRSEMEDCKALFDFTCDVNYPYRTLDGSCNNVQNPSWGLASSCYDRLVLPDYADGLSEKRISQSGLPLPTPRQISLELHSQFNNFFNNATHMLMMWGQVISHDMMLTPVSRGTNNENVECCPADLNFHPQCDPIVISEDDPFYSKYGIDCLDNVRSAPCCSCLLGPRQQINQQTAFIDASLVYGTTAENSKALRNLDGTGTLRYVSSGLNGDLLPGSHNPDQDFCSFQHDSLNCFQSGDQRTNIHPALTSMHTIFLREHNSLARRLKRLNPSWNEDKLFQEARRIVIAEMQMISYDEFLPVVLGKEMMQEHRLSVQKSSNTRYRADVPPRVYTEFSSAAYRFGHSVVRGFFPVYTNGSGSSGKWLKDVYLFPFDLYHGQLDGIVNGLFRSSPEHADRHIVDDLTNHLYQASGKTNGLDLAAINVNRGRDHGIPGYTTLLKFCGGPQIDTWDQLDLVFRKGIMPMFQQVYESVDDIDLFTGGLAEQRAPGALVGPTFACIIARQFSRIKYGDRFYFEHREQAGSFTHEQLQEIRKITLSKIICWNTRIEAAQRNVILFPNEKLRSLLTSGLLLAVFSFSNNVNGKDIDRMFDECRYKISKEREAANLDSNDSYEQIWTPQRIFEYLDDQINLYYNDQRGDLYKQVQNHPDYRDAVQRCVNSRHQSTVCDPLSSYRTYDGSCNNLMHPSWGSAEECIQRLLPIYYEGSYGIRQSVTGSPLPRPRDLSLNICSGLVKPATDTSFLFAIFGQFVVHEMTLSSGDPSGSSLKCCPLSEGMDERCDPILVRSNDSFYSKFHLTCMPNLRTPPCKKCTLGKRQQANHVTPVLDGSIVYSTSQEKAGKLRRNDGTGALLSRMTRNGELLPINENPQLFCPNDRTRTCFDGGDVRINQHSPLMALQTIFMREHNRIVLQLKKFNPQWEEEKLFQEGRKVLGAELQVIVYKELLPWLVGPKLMDDFGLWIRQDGGGTCYDPSVRLATFAESSTAALRLHSMVSSRTGLNNVTFKDLYFNTNLIYTGKMNPLLIGLRQTPSAQFSTDLIEDINGYLYLSPGEDHGFDLAALDIERGRDHGLPPYVRLMEFCFNGKVTITTFDDLAFIMSPENIQLLKDNYADVQDVDAWIGMQMERHTFGAVVGPTTACVTAKQFYSVKYGDRFYFEHVGQNTSFTTAQREALKSTTLSRLFCDNTELNEMQGNALLLPGPNNKMLSCNCHPKVDLSAWKV